MKNSKCPHFQWEEVLIFQEILSLICFSQKAWQISKICKNICKTALASFPHFYFILIPSPSLTYMSFPSIDHEFPKCLIHWGTATFSGKYESRCNSDWGLCRTPFALICGWCMIIPIPPLNKIHCHAIGLLCKNANSFCEHCAAAL